MEKTATPYKKPTQPWKPASFLKVDERYHKPGFRQRWIRKDNLDKAMVEGWTPVTKLKGISNAVAPEKTLIDGSQIDTTVQKRTLILCEMPEEIALARQEFFDKLTNSGLETMKENFTKETTDPTHGARAYGKVEIKETKGE